MAYRLFWCALIVLAIVAGVAHFVWRPRAVTVSIRNATDGNFSDVEVTFRGGAYTLNRLPAFTERCLTVYPDSESGLKLKFTDPKDVVRTCSIAASLESGCDHLVRVKICPDGKVAWTMPLTLLNGTTTAVSAPLR